MILRGSLIACLVCAAATPAAPADTPCTSATSGTGGTVAATAIRDPQTLVLDDGRELRLAAIETTEQSRAALQTAIARQPLRFATVGDGVDRYGRIVAFAFPGDSATSLQEMLLAQGHARVAARVSNPACADHLRTLERTARQAGLGQWTNPNFAPLGAENYRQLQAERGHFVLVEGKVISVRDSGGTTYVNFGRRWTQALTVTILRRDAARFAAAGLQPKRLEGRRLLVRGIVEQRTGPTIEAAAPEQIELVDER